MNRNSIWLLMVLGLLATGCPMVGGGGNGNDNGNNNGNDDGNGNDDDGVDDTTLFTATLDGAQETPPVVTEGTGQGTATLTNNQLELIVEVTASGLSGPVTAAHIHNAPAGEPGDVLFDLSNFIQEVNGVVTISTTIVLGTDIPDIATVTDLFMAQLYFNLHTAANPGGEIRGQILAADDSDDDDNGNDNGDLPQDLVALFEATLDGAQEMPPVASSGTGTGSVGVTANDEFVVQVRASGLTGPVTTAHIHMGNVGVAGDIVLHLTEHVVESDGVVTINVTVTEADFEFSGRQTALDALRAGVLYFNLHTELNPAGEIRGQLIEFDDTPGDDDNGAG